MISSSVRRVLARAVERGLVVGAARPATAHLLLPGPAPAASSSGVAGWACDQQATAAVSARRAAARTFRRRRSVLDHGVPAGSGGSARGSRRTGPRPPAGWRRSVEAGAAAGPLVPAESPARTGRAGLPGGDRRSPGPRHAHRAARGRGTPCCLPPPGVVLALRASPRRRRSVPAMVAEPPAPRRRLLHAHRGDVQQLADLDGQEACWARSSACRAGSPAAAVARARPWRCSRRTGVMWTWIPFRWRSPVIERGRSGTADCAAAPSISAPRRRDQWARRPRCAPVLIHFVEEPLRVDERLQS